MTKEFVGHPTHKKAKQVHPQREAHEQSATPILDTIMFCQRRDKQPQGHEKIRPNEKHKQLWYIKVRQREANTVCHCAHRQPRAVLELWLRLEQGKYQGHCAINHGQFIHGLARKQ